MEKERFTLRGPQLLFYAKFRKSESIADEYCYLHVNILRPT